MHFWPTRTIWPLASATLNLSHDPSYCSSSLNGRTAVLYVGQSIDPLLGNALAVPYARPRRSTHMSAFPTGVDCHTHADYYLGSPWKVDGPCTGVNNGTGFGSDETSDPYGGSHPFGSPASGSTDGRPIRPPVITNSFDRTHRSDRGGGLER